MSDALAAGLGGQGVLEGSGGCFRLLRHLLGHGFYDESAQNVSDDNPPHASVWLAQCRDPPQSNGLQNWTLAHSQSTATLQPDQEIRICFTFKDGKEMI